MKIFITSRGSASLVVSTVVCTEKKIKFGILVFLEAQEMNFRGTRKVNIMTIVYFYVNFFRFTKKFLPLLTLKAFFEIFLTQLPAFLPMIFGTYVHWLIHGTLINKNYANKINCRFTEKVCKFAIR